MYKVPNCSGAIALEQFISKWGYWKGAFSWEMPLDSAPHLPLMVQALSKHPLIIYVRKSDRIYYLTK